MKRISLLFAAGLWLAAGPIALAQGRGNNKDEDKKEYKYDKSKKGKEYKDKDKDDKDRYKAEGSPYGDNSPRSKEDLGGVPGRVVLPTAGSPGPRRLARVPRGHYPPPGQCRVWHPGRPPGHQPPPTDCQSLVGAPGAGGLQPARRLSLRYGLRLAGRRAPPAGFRSP